MSDNDRLYTLITGASSGIGRALAIRLSGTRRLMLHGRDIPRLNETIALCANPECHLIWPCDFAEISALRESLAGFLAEKGIYVESFIHSAGMLKVLPIRNVDCGLLNAVMNVNFASAVQIISLLVRKSINHQHLKDILLVSSIASNFGVPGFSIYSASKCALESLMRSLAVELAPRTRVNAITAGGMKTPVSADLLTDADARGKFARDYPLGLGEPDDIVNAAEFLLSPGARWVTGQALVIDGGRTISISS